MQRTYDEMMNLIMEKAGSDERIRAVTMEGSRANENAVHDEYSDFDICYYVTDIREFTNDKHWTDYFGEMLIMQCPEDWYDHPYDYTGYENYPYLMQFADGNRIDLTLIDIRNIKEELKNDEPRIVLLNKDNFEELLPVDTEEAFFIKKPSEKEYLDTCNEFRWLSVYITKGLCRRELYYAKHSYDVFTMDMFIKMINWKVAIDHDFKVTTGGYCKYLKRYLTQEEMERFSAVFPDGSYEDIWKRLFIMYDYFAELAEYVADKLGYVFDFEETKKVREFLQKRYEEYLVNCKRV